MCTQELITKVSQIIQRDDGSEVKIVAEAIPNPPGQISDVYVLRRSNPKDDWSLCSKQPHPDWKTMSLTDYIAFGRSEMLRLVSHSEILKVSSWLGKPMSSMPQ